MAVLNIMHAYFPCMQVAAMQRDSSTYCDEPEDAAEYAAWRGSSFSMDKAQPEIDKIMAGGCSFSHFL
jgi:hypothetical protein